MSEQELRDRINQKAGACHDIAREILGIDWYDTESAARRVIEYIAQNRTPPDAILPNAAT